MGVGGEYRLETKYGRIPLRAWFRFDQLPQPQSISVTSSNVGYNGLGEPFEMPGGIINMTRVATDRQSETSLSLGTGIAWSQIELDFAWRYTSGAEMTLTETGISFDEFDEENPVKTTSTTRSWERKAHEFRFTFTGYF